MMNCLNFLYKNTDLIIKADIKDKSNIEKLLIDIRNILKNYNKNKLDSVKFLYINRFTIHDILYKLNKVIRLDFKDEKEDNLSYYFYLSLLIRDNDDLINYSYPIEYIRIIIIQTKKFNGKYNKIIISKIILELINNYKELYEYEYNNREIDAFEVEYTKIINDNINIFKEFGINLNYEDLMIKKIDEIYSQIIISLIKNKKFEDLEYTYNIIKQLDLESIDITNRMFEEILNILDNEDIKNRYIIVEPEDLFEDIKLNFYFILFKYILKDSNFIYRKEFLAKIKKLIIVNLYKFSSDNIKNLGKEKEKKLNEILGIFLNLKYYNKNIVDKNGNNKNSNLKDFSTKIYFSDKIITNYNNNNNNNDQIIKAENNNNNFNIQENENKQKSNNNSISNNNNSNNSIINNNIKSVNISINQKSRINHILVTQGNKNNYSVKGSSLKNPKIIIIYLEFYEIIEFQKILVTKNQGIQTTSDFVVEKNKIIVGNSNNLLYLYNSEYKLEKVIKTSDWINNVFCSLKADGSLKILASSKNKLCLHEYKEGIIRSNNYDITGNNINHFIGIQESKNNYYCCCEDKVVSLSNIFEPLGEKSEDIILNNFSAKSIIQINKFLFVIKSNKIVSKGKDTLIFISEKKEINVKLKGNYSFVYTANGLAVMPIERIRNTYEDIYKDKVLLCACKKYLKSQMNGILLVDIKVKDKYEINISSNFYSTGNFEVYCICPLLKFSKDKILEDFTISDTDYFLVGGLDLDRCKGMLKLYKINYDIEYTQTTIEYIQDIIFYCKGAISCITQSSENGDILISCWDGNVYLFKNINIDFYLENDKQDELLKYLEKY